MAQDDECIHPQKTLVEDEHGGETVCGCCGTVVSEGNPAKGTGKLRHGDEGDRSHDAILRAYDPSTVIGHPDSKIVSSVYRMRLTDRRATKLRGMKQMRDRIRKIHGSMDVPDYVAETAFGLYEKIARKDAELMRENSGKVKDAAWKRIGCIMRGGGDANISVCGIYYAALKLHGISKPLRDVGSPTGVSAKEVYKAYKKVYNGLGLEDMVKGNLDELDSRAPYIHMAKITNGLGLTEPKARALTSYIVEMYEGLPSDLRGGDPATKVGALLMLAKKYGVEVMRDVKVTQASLSRSVGVTDVGIRNNQKKIEGFLRELYRSEGIDVDSIAKKPAKEPMEQAPIVKPAPAPVRIPAEPKPDHRESLRLEMDRIVSHAGLGDDARLGAYRVYGMFADGLGCLERREYKLVAASIVYAGCRITPGVDLSIKEFSKKIGVGPSSIFGLYRKVYESKPEVEELVKGRTGK
jgi:transcription initiation factor TFIIIB Brf1 subunit/transcription initiation factor TFIIB